VKQQLAATVATAWKSGFKIKVAVIGSPYDLGSVTALWLKPRIYAHFLWQEIQFYFKGRLLVAMPNGFGIYNGAKSVQGDEKVLAKIHHGDDPNSFVSSVTAAVRALAAAHGHTLK
jgi:hypothetical protein